MTGPTRPWPPQVTGEFGAYVDRYLAPLVSAYELETQRRCAFDRAVVAWLQDRARAFVAEHPEQEEDLLTAYGILLLTCIVESKGGAWAAVRGQLADDLVLLCAKLSANVYVVPWMKVVGYVIERADADSLLGFFDAIGTEVTAPRDTVSFVS